MLDLRVLHDVIRQIHVLVVLVPGGDDDAAGGVVAVAASGWFAEHTPKSSGKNDI